MAIQWTQFDWPSFATLAAGMAAVIGATIVGFRQAGIAQRQADIADRQAAILNRQADLQEYQLKKDLFDRRYTIYRRTNAFLNEMVSRRYSPKIVDEWARSALESEFLFDDDIFQAMRALRSRADSWHNIVELREIHDRRTGEFRAATEQDEYWLLGWFAKRRSTLPDLFGPSLRLGAGPTSREQRTERTRELIYVAIEGEIPLSAGSPP